MVFLLTLCILGAMLYNKNIKPNEYVKIPSYVMLLIICLTGFYVLYKEQLEIIEIVIPSLFLLSSIAIFAIKKQFNPEILNSTFGNLLPPMLIAVFIVNISYLPNNRMIFNEYYNDFIEFVGLDNILSD